MLKNAASGVLDTREASLVKREASESGTNNVSRSTLHERQRRLVNKHRGFPQPAKPWAVTA
jgi:hypothetical protein